ncbi:pyridoxamine 5'-phosphate oxidase family protein [Mycolicibacterium thermoresistibile]
MSRENVRKLADVLNSLNQVMLTTVDHTGQLVSRPMAVRVVAFDGSLTFLAPLDSRLITELSARPDVNISYTGPTASVSISGTATCTPNPQRVGEHWHPGLAPWLRVGLSDAALIEVTVDEARLWTYTDVMTPEKVDSLV